MLNSGQWQFELLTAAVVAILQLLSIIHILISKHANPAQSVFWLLLVTLLPGVGLLGYLFLGITRYEHVRSKVIRMRKVLSGDSRHLNSPSPWAEINRSLAAFQLTGAQANTPRMIMLDRLFPEHPALTGNQLEKLEDGIAAYPRMLADIKNARSTVRLQSYILNSDEIGQMFMTALAERAAAGVDVKILFDSVGSFKSYFSQYFRKELRQNRKNFRIKAFSPVNLLAPWKFQLRNHRKLLVIDGQIAYVGGINISAGNIRSRRLPPSQYIHDLHCRITGPAVSQLSLSFLTDYLYSCRSSQRHNALHSGDCTLPVRTGKSVVRVLPGGPGNTREATRKLFFAAAALAQKELWLQTPYFVPGRDYVNALCMAAARGVDVRIVVPAEGNHFYMTWAAQNFFDQLHEAGVKIYEKLGYFAHTKALLVDSEWGFMGSSNCDSRSFYLNFELDFCFEGDSFTSEMVRQFQQEFSGSRKLTQHRLSSTPEARKLLNSIAALFTPIL